MYDMLSFLFQADLLSQCLFEGLPSFIHDFPSRCCYDRSHAIVRIECDGISRENNLWQVTDEYYEEKWPEYGRSPVGHQT